MGQGKPQHLKLSGRIMDYTEGLFTEGSGFILKDRSLKDQGLYLKDFSLKDQGLY